MADAAAVRVFSVGFGDCIFAKIPDGDDFFTMLIDCGTSGNPKPLTKALTTIKTMLPVKAGKKQLDLLVVTHPHADHLKGFDSNCFKDIKVSRIWLSCFMKEDHPQARKSHALQALAERAAYSLLSRGISSEMGLDTLLANSISNPSALKALRITLPQDNGIETVYVSRDVADPNLILADGRKQNHDLTFYKGTTCLNKFAESSTRLRILAPEWDIDGYYLGEDVPNYDALRSLFTSNRGRVCKATASEATSNLPQPSNISRRDFRLLCQNLMSSALSFAQDDDALKNNTSIVLLLEWHGRRLLFAGDAEWSGTGVNKGRRNSNWDVMLQVLADEDCLSTRLDFLKVGHHGSVNGSPYVDKQDAKQVVLDKILPKRGKAKVVVSTISGKHGDKKEVPYIQLMKELGLRCTNSREYPENPGIRQPQRTDWERSPWVDIEIG
jgi:beta-lactamase superfamily II metal-dependent hydrolase